jgi:cation:H+ antiporter
VIISLFVLAISADKFVEGASAVARGMGISPLLIGLTIVSFGTSAPEILIAIMSASSGSAPIALGNALGSNIANIALILGTASLFMPIPVSSGVLRREIPLLLAVVFFSAALLLDLHLSRGDGIASFAVLILVLGWLIWQGKTHTDDDSMTGEYAHSLEEAPSGIPPAVKTLIALLLLLVSSRAMVWGAVEIARAANVSELLIGLSIVAIGTSLPELAATIACVLRREYGLAIGNVVGSNMFNALAVTGVIALLAPGDVEALVRNRDLALQLILTVLLFVFAVGWRGRQGRINRFEGLLFVGIFVAYQYWLFASVAN